MALACFTITSTGYSQQYNSYQNIIFMMRVGTEAGVNNSQRVEDMPNEWTQMLQGVQVDACQGAVHLQKLGPFVSLLELLYLSGVHQLALNLWMCCVFSGLLF